VESAKKIENENRTQISADLQDLNSFLKILKEINKDFSAFICVNLRPK